MEEETKKTESAFSKKQYKVRIVPFLRKSTTEEDGTTTKAVWCRTSKPSEAAQEANFKPTRFYHLEIYNENANQKLGGDTKPYTIVIFENTDKILFSALNELEQDEKEYTLLENSKVKVLNEKIPGRVRVRPAPAYYATRFDKNGETVKLQQNERLPNGSYAPSDVILEKVSYFLFENECNEQSDEVKYISAVKRTKRWQISPSQAEPDGSENLPKEEPEGGSESKVETKEP